MTVGTLKLILASRSPRRQELLSRLGYEFGVAEPGIEESQIPGEKPAAHVLRLALEKARRIASSFPSELVIGADTIVVLDEIILGKPSSPDEAVNMLKSLSGREHVVYTGLSMILLDGKIEKSDYDATKVIFNNLDDRDIFRYVESGEPMDKAGAYGIQGMGSFLVDHYEGEFDTVIGFPTKLFARMLEEVVSCRNR